MIITEDRHAIMAGLADEPLRNVSLLKHLFLYPRNTRAVSVMQGDHRATLVHLETSASPWDHAVYGDCAWTAFLSSDTAALSAALLDHVPLRGGVVYKLQSEADRAVLAERTPSEQTACFFSYTAESFFSRDGAVRVTARPREEDYALIAEQGHDRAGLAAQLASSDAFFCVLDDRAMPERPAALCCVFRNHGSVFEIGGVVTRRDRRRQGLARRVVATALAVVGERGLIPRYHVEGSNTASIALADGLGLRRFLTLTHHRVRGAAEPAMIRPAMVADGN